MEKGGMHDQLGGGFHRYSVDEYWFVPHFEKMLYDQAQLAISYLEAFQITREAVLARAARGILDYVMRDMTAPGGGFYSAEDADSAPDAAQPKVKTEGAFYIWAWSEIETLLGAELAAKFAASYGMERDGNVANDPHHEFTGRNILFQSKPEDDSLAEARRILFEARAKRPRPHLDDKILTAWNGLMISAFAKGSSVLNEPKYATAAKNAAEFIQQKLGTPDGGLLRRFRDDDAAIDGMLDDYAFYAQGLLDLYEATFDYRYLADAIAITQKQRELFEDEAGGFFASAHEDTSKLMKIKEDYDGAEPSGNSIALMNLLRLFRVTGRADFEASARRLIANFERRLSSTPHGMPQMLAACEFDIAPPREVIIAGDTGTAMVRLLHAYFDPFRVLLHASPAIAEFQPQMNAITENGVYVCENFACNAPVHDEEALFRLLK
jgi:uncharacterized protein YyaL (SSP411 family)